MNEVKKRNEIARLLMYIYQEYNKIITDNLISFWLSHLRGHSLKSCQLAARYLAEQKPHGEPKLGDFMEVLRRIESYRPPKYNPWTPEISNDRDIGDFLNSIANKEARTLLEQTANRVKLPTQFNTILGKKK